MIDLRDRMSEYPGALWGWQEGIVARVPLLRRLALGGNAPEVQDLVGEIILDETLWSCTTCRACEQACPVLIEHLSQILDMRRYLALEQGRLPDTLAQSLRNTERQGNPWGQARHERANWADGLDVPLMSQVGKADVLYWVGCAGSYDPRNQKVSQSMVRIFRAADTDFAILGAEESCNAEWARRAGEEYLYQMQAATNIETLKQYSFSRIVTQCPHCFNTLKNEYPQFGGKWKVLHHSQFIQEQISAGRLPLTGNLVGDRIVYHDSCYLGRYNDVYSAPRQVVAALPGAKLVEPRRSRQRGFCCGGGGAGMWLEHQADQRINDLRLEEIVGLAPYLTATACPFCLIMLEEARGRHNRQVPTELVDIAEAVADLLAADAGQARPVDSGAA
jgi:Fe-S oxidoreductase